MSPRSKNNRQVFALLHQARLDSRDDRLMLAAQILDGDCDSFTDLTDVEMSDLRTALNDWRLVQEARLSTGAATVEAIEHLLNLGVPASLKTELLALCQELGLNYTSDSSGPKTTYTATHYTDKDI